MTGIPESIWDSWEELLRTRWQGEQLMPIFHAYYFWFAWGRSSRTPKSTHFELSDFKTVFDGELKGDTISGEFVDPDGSGHFSLE